MTEAAGNAKAVAAADLRAGTFTRCCGTCRHASTRPGAQLVRCKLFDVLSRRTLVCDRFSEPEAR